jgi:hypothetical protein
VNGHNHARSRRGEGEQSVLQLAIGLGASTALLGQLLEGAGLEGGASLVHHRDAAGRTALHMAAQSGAALAVGALLAAGTDVHAQTAAGSTAMQLAAPFEDVQLRLAEAGAALRPSSKQAPLPRPPPRADPDAGARAHSRPSSATRLTAAGGGVGQGDPQPPQPVLAAPARRRSKVDRLRDEVERMSGRVDLVEVGSTCG